MANIRIVFDNPNVFYGPNCAVSGLLHYDLTETRKNVKEIKLQFIGAYQYYYYTYSHTKNGQQRHTHWVNQNFLTMEQPVPSIPLNPASGEIPPGNHVAPFNFVFRSPDGIPLPPSLEYYDCYVRYYVECKVKRSLLRSNDVCQSTPLHFAQPLNLQLPLHQQPIETTIEATAGTCCFSTGHIDVRVQLPRNVALYNSPLTGTFSLKNYSSSSCTVSTSLATCLMLRCGRANGLDNWTPCTEVAKRDFVKTVREETWTDSFVPPNYLQTTLNSTDEIQINVALCIKVDPGGLCNSKTVYIPLFAGLDYHSVMPPPQTRFRQASVPAAPNFPPDYATAPPMAVSNHARQQIPSIKIQQDGAYSNEAAPLQIAQQSAVLPSDSVFPNGLRAPVSVSPVSSTSGASFYNFYSPNSEGHQLVQVNKRDAPPAIFTNNMLPPLPDVAAPSAPFDAGAEESFVASNREQPQTGPTSPYDSSAVPPEYLASLERKR